jgi:hypothetical protein
VQEGLPDRYQAGQDAVSHPVLVEEEDHSLLPVTDDLKEAFHH